jgi:AcrR family transcriptional regulator
MARITRETREETRNRLLEAAAFEFARAGLERANINEISVAAGLAKGTVYNYFDSKEDLFLAVIEEATERAAAGATAASLGASTRERLWMTLDSDVKWVIEDEPFAQVLIREALAADPRLHPRIVAAAAPFLSKVEGILREGVERGEIREDVPAARLALVFTGLGEFLLLLHWGSEGAWPRLEEIPDLGVRLFLEGAGSGDERRT